MKNFFYTLIGYIDGHLKIAYIDPEGTIQSKRYPSFHKRNELKLHSLTSKADIKIKKYEHEILNFETEIKKYSQPFIPESGSGRNILRANYQAKKRYEENQCKLCYLEKKRDFIRDKLEKEQQKKSDTQKRMRLKTILALESYTLGCIFSLSNRRNYL